MVLEINKNVINPLIENGETIIELHELIPKARQAWITRNYRTGLRLALYAVLFTVGCVWLSPLLAGEIQTKLACWTGLPLSSPWIAMVAPMTKTVIYKLLKMLKRKMV